MDQRNRSSSWRRSNNAADFSPISDAFIRVADFLAASAARWQLDENRIARPEGATQAAELRYRRVLRGWYADNDLLWFGRLTVTHNAVEVEHIAVSRFRRL